MLMWSVLSGLLSITLSDAVDTITLNGIISETTIDSAKWLTFCYTLIEIAY